MPDRSVSISGEYLDSTSPWHIENSSWKALQILKMLRKHALRLGSSAEVGCGDREILTQLPRETRFSGFDISLQVSQLARMRVYDKLRFYHEALSPSAREFDRMLMVEVFEHVDDPLGFPRKPCPKSRYSSFHFPLDLSLHTELRGNIFDQARHSVEHKSLDSTYSARSIKIQQKSTRRKLGTLPRQIPSLINRNLASQLLRGLLLLALTRNRAPACHGR